MEYNDDVCYECQSLGDDYYTNSDGELVSYCGECYVTKLCEEDD